MATQRSSSRSHYQTAPPALIIQVLLAELFKSHEETFSGCLQRNDFSFFSEPFTKFYSFSQDLKTAFPRRSQWIKKINTLAGDAIQFRYQEHATLSKTKKGQLIKQLRSTYSALEPFISLCKDDENLFLFLLKNKEKIDRLMYPEYVYHFLTSLHPQGLEVVGEKMCDQYHQRGFFSQITECKLLLTQLLHECSATTTDL